MPTITIVSVSLYISIFVRVESAVSLSLWQQCLARLQDELPATEFSMWIRPLQAELSDNTLALYAPNRFVLDWVRDKYLNNINGLLNDFCGADAPQLRFEVGAKPAVQMQRGTVSVAAAAPAQQIQTTRVAPTIVRPGWDNVPAPAEPTYRSNVNVNIRLITSSKVNPTSWLARRRVRLRITPAARTTRCSFMAAPAWVKRTFYMRWVTELWRVNPMRKWFTCTPSVLYRTW